MEVLTAKATRRSTRIRVEIPIGVTSLDRRRPFVEQCMALIVSAQGCGFRSSQALALETPIILNNLPGGGSVTGKVVNCLPLGSDGKLFLIGCSLYTHGNVWGVVDPPEDWNVGAPGAVTSGPASAAPTLRVSKKSWPYNLEQAAGTRK